MRKRQPSYIDFGDLTSAAAALGRMGGLAKSPKKARAARRNGKRGGRPRADKK